MSSLSGRRYRRCRTGGHGQPRRRHNGAYHGRARPRYFGCGAQRFWVVWRRISPRSASAQIYRTKDDSGPYDRRAGVLYQSRAKDRYAKVLWRRFCAGDHLGASFMGKYGASQPISDGFRARLAYRSGRATAFGLRRVRLFLSAVSKPSPESPKDRARDGDPLRRHRHRDHLL